MLSWGSSYFDPEHKTSFVLRIKGGEGFEEQGSYVFYAHNDQDQFLLPRKGPSNLILDCVANRQFLVKNLSEYRTMHDLESDCTSTYLFGQSVAPSFFSYNFTFFYLFLFLFSIYFTLTIIIEYIY